MYRWILTIGLSLWLVLGNALNALAQRTASRATNALVRFEVDNPEDLAFEAELDGQPLTLSDDDHVLWLPLGPHSVSVFGERVRPWAFAFNLKLPGVLTLHVERAP